MSVTSQAPDLQPEAFISPELHPIQKKKNRLVLIFGVILLAVLIGVAYLLMVRSELRNIHLPDIERRIAEVFPTPTETPFPFMELTMPYLRSRKYDSNLGDLELISENESYSSYLTSYESGWRGWISGRSFRPRLYPARSIPHARELHLLRRFSCTPRIGCFQD